MKRVVDYNVKVRVKSDGSGMELAPAQKAQLIRLDALRRHQHDECFRQTDEVGHSFDDLLSTICHHSLL